MIQNVKTIDYKWLTKPTGDPFADTGGFAIEYLSEKFPQMDILELIDYITKIYVDKWGGKLNAFFLNSKITQPAFQGSRKIKETNRYFEALINETEPFETGYCRIIGRKTKLFFGGRDNSIMTGSGTLINFHHFFQKGISLSKEALIRIHFVPFACQQLQGKISLMQSSNETLSRLFVRMTIERNLHEIGVGLSQGVVKSDYNKPANAIFDFVDSALSRLAEFREGNILPSLTLYHFTNFGASPEIQLYQLPAKVFLFYRTCLQPRFQEDWQKFVRSHYYDGQHKGATYNLQSGKFELVKSKEPEVIDFDDYKQWSNEIYDCLLNDQYFLKKILKWTEEYNPFNFGIVKNYQLIVKGMKQETIEKIKELASFLVRDENFDKIKKRIQELDNVKTGYDLRYFLRKNVVVPCFDEGNEKPILTLDDYVHYIAPDGTAGSEIRDLILIAIYQELHERKLTPEPKDEKTKKESNIN